MEEERNGRIAQSRYSADSDPEMSVGVDGEWL